MHFMTRLNVTFHSGLLLWYVCYLTILEWSKYIVSPISPCAPRFPAYVDASGAQNCEVVFGSQWLQG